MTEEEEENGKVGIGGEDFREEDKDHEEDDEEDDEEDEYECWIMEA